MQDTFTTLEREPVYLKVYKAIEERISTGVLEDGSLLPTEAVLCEQFGVTRSSVREGIRLLEQAGLVARGAGKRLVIARPRTADVARAASRSMTLSGATFREVWDTLMAFYPEAARAAAVRLGPRDAAALRECQEVLAALRDDQSEAVVTAAVAFFDILAMHLHNRVMAALLQSLNRMIDKSLREVIGQTPQARRRILEAQGRITEAIADQDQAAAVNWMRKHIADLQRAYQVAHIDLDTEITW
ncbi:FadR/GntR family transcriptional regulator [Parvularcula sp. LCG005]|uniref:FadR/GntR family transcriptional regulator n=1 Tax=Parvularcula sp. LCG005 TaxID=3078805 RepID=UPI002942788A|nr:GntR family transcriptional regulator [Parvularcula sp. LCG005]WOI54562.1 GntR family transcriptional regulator [Parvularcula sp. LCG005]